MGKLKSWYQAHRPTTRRLAQLYCALLYNANLKGFAQGKIYSGNVKAVCVPGLNCYSCPGAVGACPLGALQNAVASSGTRAGTYVLGILLLFGVLLGRTVCGWLCPFGMLQELLFKIPTVKLRKNRFTRFLSYLKYVILAVFVFALPLWYAAVKGLPLPGFCKYICPAGTFEGAGGLLANPVNESYFSMLGPLFTRKFVIMVLCVLASVLCYRAFCRFLCPLGAIYGLFSRIAFCGVRVDGSRCTGCGRCVRSCQMDVRRVGDHECIQCGECMEVCRDQAISLRAGKVTLMAPSGACGGAYGSGSDIPGEKAGRKTPPSRLRIFRAAAIFVLLAALLWFNVFSPSKAPASYDNSASESNASESSASESNASESNASESSASESSAAVGSAVGEQLPDFTAELIGGGEFHLKETRGNVTIINRWATWCTPCVAEIPYFCRLKDEHPDIHILAAHSSMITEDVQAYLAEKDWNLDFTIDEDDAIMNIVAGEAVLPQTIVLNEKGEVIFNQTGSVTYELLEELLKRAQ